VEKKVENPETLHKQTVCENLEERKELLLSIGKGKELRTQDALCRGAMLFLHFPGFCFSHGGSGELQAAGEPV
jgi:hypothetical protein